MTSFQVAPSFPVTNTRARSVIGEVAAAAVSGLENDVASAKTGLLFPFSELPPFVSTQP